VIVFVPYPNEMARQIPAAGGTATPVTVADAASPLRWFPSFLPDGRHYLYLSIDRTSRRGTAVHVASLDSAETRELIPSVVSATYAEPGYLLFRRDGALVTQPFDAGTLQLGGTPVVLSDTVDYSPLGYQNFASASAGVLAYHQPESGWHLTWFDRTGRRTGGAAPPSGQFNSLCLSRDGARVVYDQVDSDRASINLDLWSFELASGVATRLTFDPAADFYPVCSPAGDEIVFASLRAGPPNLFRLVVSAPGSEALLLRTPTAKIPTGWDVWMLPLAGGQPFPFAATPAEERNAKMSPDGRFVAYTLVQGERSDVYVQSFPATGAKWQVSRDGGHHPAWSGDGRTLFFASADKKVMAVDVVTRGAELTIGQPRVAVDTRIEGREPTNQGSPYDVTPTGDRFVVSTAAEAPAPITVVLNWRGLLEK
jgi:WD40-like Beta Propeller Repeat